MTYDHIILVNPILSLTSLVVIRPNYVRRIFGPHDSWFTPVEIARSWEASPLSQVEKMKAAALIITTWDSIKSQVAVFKEKMRNNGIPCEYYRLELGQEHRISTVEMMIHWADKHLTNYNDRCFIPPEEHTTIQTNESTTEVEPFE